jgi:hypothetical protein
MWLGFLFRKLALQSIQLETNAVTRPGSAPQLPHQPCGARSQRPPLRARWSATIPKPAGRSVRSLVPNSAPGSGSKAYVLDRGSDSQLEAGSDQTAAMLQRVARIAPRRSRPYQRQQAHRPMLAKVSEQLGTQWKRKLYSDFLV